MAVHTTEIVIETGCGVYRFTQLVTNGKVGAFRFSSHLTLVDTVVFYCHEMAMWRALRQTTMGGEKHEREAGEGEVEECKNIWHLIQKLVTMGWLPADEDMT